MTTGSPADVNDDARLAYWYPGIPDDFRSWSADEKQIWVDQIEKLQAEEILRFGDAQRLQHQRIRELVYQATGDSELAHQAQMRVYENQLIEKSMHLHQQEA